MRVGMSSRNKYTVRSLIPVAIQVLKARAVLIHGLSALLTLFPAMACKFCPEVYIGEEGHLIRTCPGYGRGRKKRAHEWSRGGLDDVLVPVETFHLPRVRRPGVVRHDQRFDVDRVPAVLELCWRAGAEVDFSTPRPEPEAGRHGWAEGGELVRATAGRTLRAWEEMRSGVGRLLLGHPSRVCRHCSEVHVGPAGHRARLCGVFKEETWRGAHTWRRAEVDDLVPPKAVWRRRPQDPPALLDRHRGFYGYAPAVVDICTKGGVVAPSKYFCMMKAQGYSPPPGTSSPPGILAPSPESVESGSSAENRVREFRLPFRLLF